MSERGAEAAAWYPYKEGQTLGLPASENGLVIRDEEYSEGALVTLERDSPTAPFAITCGLYGWMVHTCWFSTATEAQEAFEEIKTALGKMADMIPYNDDPAADEKMKPIFEGIEQLVQRF